MSNTQRRFVQRLRAGTLSYVTGMSLLVVMLLMVPIAIDFYAYKELDQLSQRLRLTDQLESAISLLEAGAFQLEYDTLAALDVIDGEPPLAYKAEHWGVFDLVHLYAHTGVYHDTLSLLTADVLSAADSLCLYMPDLGNYLSIAGNTLIEGKASLPALGVVKAYIEGIGYESDTLVHGSIGTSDLQLPQLRADLSSRQQAAWLLNGTMAVLPDSLFAPYNGSTLVYQGKDPVLVASEYLGGKIIIASDSLLVITARCQLDGCMVLAKHIRVESGFRGKAQFFAQHTIEIQDSCQLRYPSVCMIVGHERANVSIGKGSVLCGLVLMEADTEENTTAGTEENTLLEIAEGSIVEGQVYNSGTTDCKGSIWGELYTRHFTHSSENTRYADLLLNVTISKYRLSSYFVGLDIGKPRRTKLCISRN